MRKRSSYKRRPVLADPLSYVLESISPVVRNQHEDLKLRLRNHTSLTALEEGAAVFDDLDVLVVMSNMTTALAHRPGEPCRLDIRAGADAVESVQKRWLKWGKVQATTQELEAIQMMLRIHDAQLESVSVKGLENAIKIVEKQGVAYVK